MTVYVIAGEYWHPNTGIFEGAVKEVCATRRLADLCAELYKADGFKVQVYELDVLEEA